MITPSKLIDIFASTRARGTTTTLVRVAEALDGLIVAPTISRAHQIGRVARGLNDGWRGVDVRGPILLDPEIMPAIAEAWDADLRRMETVLAGRLRSSWERAQEAARGEAAARAELAHAQLLLAAESGRDIHMLRDGSGVIRYADWRRDHHEIGVVWRCGAWSVRRSETVRHGWIARRGRPGVWDLVLPPEPYALRAIMAAMGWQQMEDR